MSTGDIEEEGQDMFPTHEFETMQAEVHGVPTPDWTDVANSTALDAWLTEPVEQFAATIVFPR